MFLKLYLLFLIVHVLCFGDCVEDEWTFYESKLKHHNREEIFIANITTDPAFKTNFTVGRWKTLNVGIGCYAGGVANNTVLVILFSSISRDGSGLSVSQKHYDLEVPINDVEFFHERKNGNQAVFVVAYNPNSKELMWWSVNEQSLRKMWTWPMEGSVTYFNFFKMNNKNFLLASLTSDLGLNYIVIYGFNSVTLEKWLFQSIPLPSTSSSACVSVVDGTFYLSIVQPLSNKLLVYRLSDKSFIRFDQLTIQKIDQVICFENGFRSFIAVNGLNAGIYEFTINGLNNREVINSNLEAVQFWLPIPVNTYRDETILLCQRTLDHETHNSFDVDVVTYNGNRFEDHVDIPCSIFGEQQNGLRCLSEYNSNSGILGGAYVAVEDHLSLILPNDNNISTLLNIEIGLRKVEHPVKKELESLLERKKILQAMIDEQNAQLAKKRKQTAQFHLMENTPKLKSAETFLEAQTNNERERTLAELKSEVEDVAREVETMRNVVKDGNLPGQERKFKTIIFNGPVEIQHNLTSEIINTTDEELINELNDIVRKDQLKVIQAPKTFYNITAEEVTFEIANGVSGTGFVNANHGSVEVAGDIIFEKPVDAIKVALSEGTVNDGHVDEWINVGNLEEGSLFAEQLVAQNNFEAELLNGHDLRKELKKDQPKAYVLEALAIPENITVKTLSGQDFEGFIRKLCVNNVKCHIPNLNLRGAMNIEENANIKYLNGLEFPQEYVKVGPKQPLVITGAKTFNNIIRGNKITVDNALNNVDLSKIVDLSSEQHIAGTIVFDNLEVTSDLNVDGALKGEELDKIIPNRGLMETTNITANVEFRNLEVLGDIIVKDHFMDTKFDEYLDNFVLKNENATITGSKSFPQGFTVLENLYVDSHSINNISLDSIITKDTDQDLLIESFPGNVDFDRLKIQGLFDGQNITELNKTLVKLTGNQTVASELVFMDDVFVETLIVEQVRTDGAAEDADLNWEYLEAESVVVEGNIVGKIDHFDLQDLKENHVNYFEDQTISEPYFVNTLTSNSEIRVKYVNNEDFGDVFSRKKISDNVTDILAYRNVTVGCVNVEGSVNVRNINDENVETLFENHAWMKLHQNASRLIIDGDVYFDSLEIEKLGNVLFEEYVKILIFKNETDVEIQGSLRFTNEISVKKLIETLTLNDVALENVLRKTGDQIVVGPVNILGDVTIDDDVTVKEMINNVEVTYMLENFDLGEESLKVKGEVFFRRIPYIKNLTIHGLINGNDLNTLKNKFAYRNGDVYMENNIIFNEPVRIDGNLGVTRDVNGIDLSELHPRIAWLIQDVDIEGPVKFTDSVDCPESLIVEEAFNTERLLGVDLDDRIHKGVVLNKGLIEGIFRFENMTINENLQTKFINNINMDLIIPLKTSQEINELDINKMSVAHDFDVGNEVNGVNLTVERDRTSLGNVEQGFPAEIVFLNNVLVEDHLRTPAINGRNTSKIVTTNTDQHLTASYNFKSKCLAEQYLVVSGLINGINLTSWKDNTIPAHSDETLHIKEKWMVMENLNLIGPLNGIGTVNDINITRLVNDVKERESYMCDIEKAIANDFTNMCTDMSYIYKNAKKQIYKFEYFEEFQTLTFPDQINYAKPFEVQGKHYMLVNQEGSCFSDLMLLGPKGFTRINTVSTGGIAQIETVKDGSDLFLVSRGLDVDDLTCDIRFSTVIWKWTDGDLEIIASTEAQELLQESLVPLTFYGFKHGVVTEFKIDSSTETVIQEFRKWQIAEDNAAFIPQGLKTGPALRTGKNVIFLKRTDPVIDEEYNLDTQKIILDNVSSQWNNVFPGRNGGDITVVNVGTNRSRRALVAVANHKQSQVEHRLDLVEVYLDPFKGELFDQILTYRPSGLISVEFGNGETLLAFMEDKKVLQIYEYKGIEGFRHRSSIKIQADRIFLTDLLVNKALQKSKVLGIIRNSKITLLQAIMMGSKVSDDLQCAV